MALIKCPDCEKEVSDKAENCIHCGCPLKLPDYIVKFKTPTLPKCVLRVKFVFYDDSKKEVLGEARQGEIISLKIKEATTIRIHLGRGFKDAILEYEPHQGARYCILERNTFLGAKLVIQEVDFFDSDN